MALKPDTNFAGKINPATSAYPYGSARNVTTQNDGTGTPFIDLLINDIFGLQQALLQEAGITPSGSPDTATNSQYLDALKDMVDKKRVFGRTLTLAEAVANTRAVEGDTVVISDRGNGLFEYKTGETANTYNIVACTGVPTLALKLITGMVINPEQWGVSPSATNDFNREAFQEIFDVVSMAIVTHNQSVEVSKDPSNPWCIRNTNHRITVNGKGRITYLGGGAQIFRSENADYFEWTGVELIGNGLDGSDTGFGLLQLFGGFDINIHDCRIADSDSDGVAVASATRVKVHKVNSSNCSKSGVYVNNSSDVEITGCTPSGGGGQLVGGSPVGAAIQASGNTRCTIADNQIQNYIGIGILVDNGTNKPFITNIHDNVIDTVSNPTNVPVEGGIVCENGDADKATLTVLHNNICKNVRQNAYKFENHSGLTSSKDKAYLSGTYSMSIGTGDGVRVEDFSAYNGGQDSVADDIVLLNACDDAKITNPKLEDLPDYAVGSANHRVVDSSSGSNRIEYPPVEYSINWNPNGGAAIAPNTTVDTSGVGDIVVSGLGYDAELAVIPPINLNGMIANATVPASLGKIRVQLSNNSGVSRTVSTTDLWRVIVRRFQQS